MRVDQRKKGNTSGQVNSDTAAQKVTQGGGLMEDRTSEINEPITREEDVMEVTQPRATTGENSESLQLEREAENQGDYFEEKINEIDSDLMKFELKKDSGNGCAVNKETAVDLEGETENSGEMLNILPRGLEASEKFKENKKHVTEEEENPKVNATLVLGETKEAMASSFPTWKRIVRKETGIIRIATPLRTLKRSSAELVEAEGMEGGNTIWERLDRAVATTDWIDKFPATKVAHLECGSSDHKPLIIRLKEIQIKQQRPWRFEQMWLEDTGCSEVVDLAWKRNFPGNPIAQVEEKIKECQVKLKQWSRVSFGSINRSLKEKKQLLKQAKQRAIRGGTMEAVNRLKWEINGFCDRACEMTIHALWECDKVLGCWGHVFKNLRSQELGVGSFADLVFTVRKQGENMELFIVVAWFIWSRRNKMHFNEQHLPPDKILDAATALLADFHEKPDSKPGRNLIRTQCWVPPAERMYKNLPSFCYLIRTLLIETHGLSYLISSPQTGTATTGGGLLLIKNPYRDLSNLAGPKDWLKEQKRKSSSFILAPIDASRQILRSVYLSLAARDLEEIQELLRLVDGTANPTASQRYILMYKLLSKSSIEF
nr:hypothetical protein CFP56_26656 [Quercus suber]